MQASPRSSFVASLIAVVLAHVPAATLAAPPPDLVVVGEPTASEALADPHGRGPVTLAYRVAEVFAGEIEGASLVVRHESLGPEDRSRLRDGERVILLARRDPASPGRWLAPAPLRATPSAVAAFRKWSAPEDVRAARPVESVVAEISGARPATPGPTTTSEPTTAVVAAREPAPAPAKRPAAIEVEEETLAPRREVSVRAAASVVAPAAPATTVESPSIAPKAASAHDAAIWAPPLLIDPALQPRPGPGLPPSPGHASLGPELRERSDLHPPPRGRRR